MDQVTFGWRLRLRVFAQRFWQPTCACMTAMPGSLGNVLSASHWLIALRTGLLTGALALLISFTPLRTMFVHRVGNAAIVGVLSALGDIWSHPNHYGFDHAEALLTGAISFALALAGSYLLEDGARRVRALFASRRLDDDAGR
jgi:hypothetical protein